MRSKTIANCTKSLVKGGAKNGIRLGARGLHEFRTARVTFGDSVGYCEAVLFPGTRVIAQASASISEPLESRPGEGLLTISVWVSPAATGEMVGSSDKPSSIARTLEKMFKDNRAVDLESLCIKFGELAWILRVDVHIIDMNGCLQETAALAVLGALLTFQRPHAEIDPETEELIVLPLEKSNPVEMHLFHLPALTSFVLCDSNLLAEPCHEEEEIFPGKLLIGITDSKELCHLHMTNPIDQSLLLEATQLAQSQCLDRLEMLKAEIAKIKSERSVPMYMRPVGPRKNGVELTLTEVKQMVQKAISSKRKSAIKSSAVATLSSADINIMEDMAVS